MSSANAGDDVPDVSLTSGDKSAPTKEGTSELDPFSLGQLFGVLACFSPVVYVLLFLIEYLATLWRPLGLVLYLVLLVFSIVVLISGALQTAEYRVGEHAESGVVTVVVTIIVGVTAFSQLGRYWYLIGGGFTAQGVGYWHWMRFGVANLLEAALLDMPNVYAWNVSEVRPNTFWSRGLVFSFRAVTEFLIVGNLLGWLVPAWRLWRHPEVKRITPRADRDYLAFIIPNVGVFLLFGLWFIPFAILIGGVASDGIYLESSWSAIGVTTPIVLGIWFTLQNLRALSVPGRSNKLLALLGATAGFWLAYHWWSRFLEFLAF